MEVIRQKYSYFSLPLVKLTRVLSEIYQAEDNCRQAGRIMASIDTEDQYFVECMTIIERCDWRIQTAQLFLEDGDNTSATRHIVAAKQLLRDVPSKSNDRQRLQLQHKTCYSRILDSERKFLAAAVNYLELSQITQIQVSENDLLISLENAVTCAILAPAGGNRTRVLAMLYRDERSKQLKNYRVLERMHKNMLLPRKDMDAFANTLEEHHQAELAGGLTVLEKAVYEHNMLAASQIYKNVKISELAKLLGVNDMQAEDLARIMIQEGRMSATIDQIEEVIEFHSKKGSELLEWDEQIQDLLLNMNDLVDMISDRVPNCEKLGLEIP
jgi:COP9 signalosome complex subunit 4